MLCLYNISKRTQPLFSHNVYVYVSVYVQCLLPLCRRSLLSVDINEAKADKKKNNKNPPLEGMFSSHLYCHSKMYLVNSYFFFIAY